MAAPEQDVIERNNKAETPAIVDLVRIVKDAIKTYNQEPYPNIETENNPAVMAIATALGAAIQNQDTTELKNTIAEKLAGQHTGSRDDLMPRVEQMLNLIIQGAHNGKFILASANANGGMTLDEQEEKKKNDVVKTALFLNALFSDGFRAEMDAFYEEGMKNLMATMTIQDFQNKSALELLAQLKENDPDTYNQLVTAYRKENPEATEIDAKAVIDNYLQTKIEETKAEITATMDNVNNALTSAAAGSIQLATNREEFDAAHKKPADIISKVDADIEALQAEYTQMVETNDSLTELIAAFPEDDSLVALQQDHRNAMDQQASLIQFNVEIRGFIAETADQYPNMSTNEILFAAVSNERLVSAFQELSGKNGEEYQKVFMEMAQEMGISEEQAGAILQAEKKIHDAAIDLAAAREKLDDANTLTITGDDGQTHYVFANEDGTYSLGSAGYMDGYKEPSDAEYKAIEAAIDEGARPGTVEEKAEYLVAANSLTICQNDKEAVIAGSDAEGALAGQSEELARDIIDAYTEPAPAPDPAQQFITDNKNDLIYEVKNYPNSSVEDIKAAIEVMGASPQMAEEVFAQMSTMQEFTDAAPELFKQAPANELAMDVIPPALQTIGQDYNISMRPQ